MPPTLVRSFIALYPDAEALRHISHYLSCLSAKDRSVKWEQPRQVHITLKFLGDMQPKTLDVIAKNLDAMFRGSGAAEALIDTVGGFPNLRDPRIVWLGFRDAVPRMLELQRAVETVCEAEGVERESKRFTPHFTIGRVRNRGGAGDLENVLAACSFQAVPVRCTAIRIMESTLTPQGAMHRERASIILTPGE